MKVSGFDKFNHNPPMLASTQPRLVLHTATFAAWALAAAGVGYWVLQISANTGQVNLPLVVSANGGPSNANDPAVLARLLGALAPQAAAPVNNNNRFVLKGVVSGALGQEAALIVIDDKPAIAFRVGSAIENSLILQSAAPRKVTLAASKDGPAVLTLEMPPLSK